MSQKTKCNEKGDTHREEPTQTYLQTLPIHFSIFQLIVLVSAHNQWAIQLDISLTKTELKGE